MIFTLHQLQVFLKVAETHSITRAAEELHLTQPAISIQIKNLQEQFELPLIEVVGKKVFLTDFGKEIAESARNIAVEVEAINSKVSQYRGQLTGKLKITVVSTGKYVIPSFLTDFMKENPGIELMLDVTNRTRVIESLQKNEVDFALVSVMPEKIKVEGIELMENKLFLIGNNQKLAKQENDITIFNQLPLIFREPGSGTRQVMEKYIKQNHISTIKKMELTSNEAVKQAVLADLGYSIMPVIGIRNELNSGKLQIMPVKGFPIKSKWSLIWLKNKKFSPVAMAYRTFLEKEKSRIIKEKFEGSDAF